MQREKLRGRAGRRAWNYEKRLDEGKRSGLARECRLEMRERNRRGEVRSAWEIERKEFFEERNMRIEEVEDRMGEESEWFNDLMKKDKEKQEEERWEKIRESRYNRWYKEVKEKGIPEYLRKEWEESRWRRVARYRLGNEMREGR